MEEPDNQTVAAIMDDLDNYGGHLRMLIEDSSGRLWRIGLIRHSTPGGIPTVIMETGEPIQH